MRIVRVQVCGRLCVVCACVHAKEGSGLDFKHSYTPMLG